MVYYNDYRMSKHLKVFRQADCIGFCKQKLYIIFVCSIFIETGIDKFSLKIRHQIYGFGIEIVFENTISNFYNHYSTSDEICQTFVFDVISNTPFAKVKNVIKYSYLNKTGANL